MDVPSKDMAAVGEAVRAVMREAKHAGVYVFGGGINEDIAPLMVAADGSVTNVTSHHSVVARLTQTLN
jgi:phosphoenolpyruvate synthase/pyruvate phosphate dikinase